MKICKTKAELEAILNSYNSNMIIGFVPTMGSLHNGHLSLIKQAKRENEICVASIFVNPIQFNNPDDLTNYPRDLEGDLKLLETFRCDIVFCPSVEEMYPTTPTEIYDFGDLDKVMEGEHRPGHFNGVATIVKRLFDLIKPTSAYFGEKDYQQTMIIKKLVEQEKMNIEIVECPIIRERSGLAMSSRNALLTPENAQLAPIIYKILRDARDLVDILPPKNLKQWAINQFSIIPNSKLDYFEIADATNLQPINSWNDAVKRIACVAIYLGNIRLVDNIRM
ncbi:pantothenate synthetase [Bacteroidia bacterium]|nr:pantothenate synthetase [Bacteroidia bacterium]